VRNFQLPRGTKTYDGSTKPEDWLIDYATTVHVAGGNQRWAVHYVPQMLEGPARIWLNNLPPGSIDGWLDFEEAFNNNFTNTYKRPNRPQQLSMCRQREEETDREYLTRWSSLRNSYEGVIEAQDISWVAQGCQHGSMLWQILQREMPASLAETIRIASKIGRMIAKISGIIRGATINLIVATGRSRWRPLTKTKPVLAVVSARRMKGNSGVTRRNLGTEMPGRKRLGRISQSILMR
jgi:hypothetical protein